MDAATPPADPQCQRCGGAVDAGATDGVCTPCMLSAALGGFAETDQEKPAGANLLQRRHLGGYELLEEIARGGMGVVFRARQRRPDRPVALKVIAAGELASPRMIQRFHAETEAAARLDHANIASIYEVGQEDGWHYFSMRLIEGPTLAHHLNGRPLAPRKAAELLAKIARAVHHAHQRGVLHRDIKPNNILLETTGEPILTDFGLAKILEADSSITLSHAVLGTPAYMSPEQASGDTKDATVAADIYGLGAVLYEMLTGQPPFSAPNTPLLLRKIVEEDPQRPSAVLNTIRSTRHKESKSKSKGNPGTSSDGISRDLEVICLKCLEKLPERRYHSAAELADDLERWLRHEPILARPVTTWERALKWSQRHRGAVGAAAAIVVLLVAGITVSTWAAVRATRAERAQSQLRREAEARSYAADINVAQQALAQNNISRARELLLRHEPAPGQADLRGWEWRYLWQLIRSDAEYQLAQLSHSVVSLSVSAEGRWLAAGELRGRLVVFDLETRSEVFRDACKMERMAAAFSPREPLLAYAFLHEERTSIRFWDASTQKRVADIPLERECHYLQFSADGSKLLVSSRDRGSTFSILNVADLKPLVNVPAISWESPEIAVSGDLTVAANAGDGGTLRMIDLHTGDVLWSVKETEENIQALALSPDGAMAVGYAGSGIHLWATDSGREVGQLDGHLGYVHDICFLPGGKTVISAGSDQTIRLWNIETRREIGVLLGHEQEVWCLASLPEQRTLISGAKDGTILVWNLDRARDAGQIRLPSPARGWTFTTNGQTVLLGEFSGAVSEWSGPNFQQLRVLHNFGTNLARACFNRDGSRIAVEFPDRRALVWDLKRSRAVAQFALPPGSSYVEQLNATGDRLYLDNYTGEDFHEWNVDENRLAQSWNVPGPYALTAAYSSDGQWRIVPNLNGDTVARDLVAQTNRSFNLKIAEPDGAVLSPDSRLLAVTSLRGYVRLWEWPSLREVGTLRGLLQGAHSVLFSQDGKRLVAGSNGREALKMWDISTGRDLITLEGQGYIFTNIRFSSDGNMIGARSSGGILNIWRTPP